MTAPYDPSQREKVVAKLPESLRRDLKVRAAQLGVDIKDAVTDGIGNWLSDGAEYTTVDMAGSRSFSTYIPTGMYAELKQAAKKKGLAINQSLAQSIRAWLDAHPATAKRAQSKGGCRYVVCNQKGGVGKTAVTAGLGQALAERGARVLLVDFDPQCHLTSQFGFEPIGLEEPSLAKKMLGEAKILKLRDLIEPIETESFAGRLFLLPSSTYAFLLDAKLATAPGLRVRETALETALEEVESDFDYILIDCPPSLGYTMDNALYYGRTRDGEDPGCSGVLTVVQAEDSSADAYRLLQNQINDLAADFKLDLDQLGIVVNLYDAGRGYIATSSLENWHAVGDPAVLSVVPDLKEQREAVRLKRPLLEYAPESKQADAMRELARRLSE
ncbi:ParA family protein [Streptomyces mauvecolor]|uniref:ParA family protein n=1 Tax=Streptomyces mauvecolor TaxID=58345 RepID=A0ABV9UF97_9ACTN